MSSFQELLLNGLNSIKIDDGDIKGMINQAINSGHSKFWNPLVDIIDTDTILFLYVEIPGVNTESINISVYNNKLNIAGEKLKKYTGELYKNEIGQGKFDRQIILPISVTNKKNISLTYEDGILTIKIDKTQEELNKFTIKLQ